MLHYLETLVRAESDAFETLRINGKLDVEKLKKYLLPMFYDSQNLFGAFAIRRNSKDLFGVAITNLEKDAVGFLNGIEENQQTKDLINDTLRTGDLEFLCRWINGASRTDLSEFFLRKARPTQVQIDLSIEEVSHTTERYSTLVK